MSVNLTRRRFLQAVSVSTGVLALIGGDETANAAPPLTSTGDHKERLLSKLKPDDFAGRYGRRSQKFTTYIGDEHSSYLDRPVWTDHPKYLWPVILAIFADGPSNPNYQRAVQVMSYGSYRGTWIEDQFGKTSYYHDEFYHFAVIGLTRLMVQFKDLWDTDVWRGVLRKAMQSGDLQHPGGTLNQIQMERSSAYILAQEAEKLGVPGAPEMKMARAGDIRSFADRLYSYGMGEWDSSTYYAFSFVSYLNVYDFADDRDMKQTARAILDWLGADYALKYTNGVLSGSEDRGGSAIRSVNSYTDYMAYLWFNDAYKPASDFSGHEPFQSIHAILSGYAPHTAITNIATKSLPTPFMAFGSKADYDMTRSNANKETYYSTAEYTLGAIYDRVSGFVNADNQEVMWKLVARGSRGAHVLTGTGMSYEHRSYTSGRGPWTQVAHFGNTLIQMTLLPENADEVLSKAKRAVERLGKKTNLAWEDPRTIAGSYLSYPENEAPVEENGALFWNFDETYVAARPIAGNLQYPDEVEKGRRIAVDTSELGRPGGFALEIGREAQAGTFEAFREAVLRQSQLVVDGSIATYRNVYGDTLKMAFETSGYYYIADERFEGSGSGREPDVWVNGRWLDLGRSWDVYMSPYVRMHNQMLFVSDGRTGFRAKIKDGKVRYTPFNGARAVDTGYESRFFRVQ